MKTKLDTKNKWSRLSASSAMLIAGLCLLFLSIFASQASAQTDTLLSETFATGIPSTWTIGAGSNYWYSSSNGRGGTNGSAVADIVSLPVPVSLYSPTVDASSYANNRDSVWVDFDYCWQYNAYDDSVLNYWYVQNGTWPDYGPDNLYVWAGFGGTYYYDIDEETTVTSYTYSTTDYTIDSDPPTDASKWGHRRLLVPVGGRTSSLTIQWVVFGGGDGGYGFSNPAIDNVKITAYAPTKQLSLGRNAISLGQVRVGSHKADTLKVSAIGDTITVSSSMSTGTLFSRYPTTSNRTIAAGSTELDSVIFAPTARGTFSDSLIITSNAVELSEQRMTVYVSGQGIQAIFNSTNGNALAFGNLRVGRTEQQTFAFSNTGDDTLFLQTPTISGSGFSIISGPANRTLPPNQTSNVIVQFAPAVKQSYSGTLRFTASNGVSAPSVTLSGNGILPQIQVSNSIAFGQVRVGRRVQGTITFRNTGNDTLHLSSALLAQPSTRFILGTYEQVVLPGATGMFQITYAPNRRNIDAAQLLFTTDDPSHLADTILVSGQGIQAIFSSNHGTDSTKLAFGVMRMGRSAEQTFAFSNSGDDTLFLQLPTIMGNGFSIISNPASLTLAPNATGSVVVQFVPVAEQAYSGTLSFSASNGVPAPTVVLSGTGALPHMAVANNHETIDLGQVKVNTIASHRFAVANNGAWDLTLSSATAALAPFSIGTWPATVAGNTTGYVAVNFAPAATGPFTGTLVIAGDDSANPSDTIFLTGTGIESALSIDPVNVDFGAVPVSSMVKDTIKLSNTGTASVTINSYKLLPQSGTFAIVNSPAAQISAGGSVLVIVSFRPDAAGNYSGTLTLTTDETSAPTRTINLSGTGVKGALSVASSLDFGKVMIGQDSTISATLKNTGQGSVTINSLTMSGSEFSSGTFATPLTIAVGDSAFVDLIFTPTNAGAATGSVRVTLGDNTLVSIALTGNGVDAASVTETGAGNEFSLSISPNPASRIATAHISMMNAADGQLTVFDVTGHEVLSLPLGLLSQGAHDVSLPIENLASGSNFVRITNTSGESSSARLVLTR